MLKLIFFTALLALAKSNNVEDFNGDWTGVKIYTELAHFGPGCVTLSIEETTNFCKCGKNKRVPVISLSPGLGESIEVPVIIVESEDNVAGALRGTCNCKSKHVQRFHFVFYSLSDNYFLMYNSRIGNDMAVLLAKDVPSERELSEFVEHNDVLKARRGELLCSKETKSQIKMTSDTQAANTTSWLNYPLPHSTDTAN